ncbi:hypothetical protein PInf_023033 [Phytophthora infestans]|nr:hypothetical protein PInf_023033 [Phytophthora infestans]
MVARGNIEAVRKAVLADLFGPTVKKIFEASLSSMRLPRHPVKELSASSGMDDLAPLADVENAYEAEGTAQRRRYAVLSTHGSKEEAIAAMMLRDGTTFRGIHIGPELNGRKYGISVLVKREVDAILSGGAGPKKCLKILQENHVGNAAMLSILPTTAQLKNRKARLTKKDEDQLAELVKLCVKKWKQDGHVAYADWFELTYVSPPWGSWFVGAAGSVQEILPSQNPLESYHRAIKKAAVNSLRANTATVLNSSLPGILRVSTMDQASITLRRYGEGLPDYVISPLQPYTGIPVTPARFTTKLWKRWYTNQLGGRMRLKL